MRKSDAMRMSGFGPDADFLLALTNVRFWK
jgi:hypothetical protein